MLFTNNKNDNYNYNNSIKSINQQKKLLIHLLFHQKQCFNEIFALKYNLFITSIYIYIL